MIIRILIISLILMLGAFNLPMVRADGDDSKEINALKGQVQQLLKRIEDLEKAQKEVVKPKINLAKASSKLKIKGRWAAGLYNSGKSGSYPVSSFEVPEAKVQLGFAPDEINEIILRLNLNNATFNNLDYLYVDTDLAKFFNLPVSLSSRLGRFKLDFGEETWGNNPVENVLPSPSASNTNANDEGLQLSGKVGPKERPVGWAVSISGNSGTGFDEGEGKAIAGKLSYNILDPLYVSASYYHSGSLGNKNVELSIAGLSSPPSSARDWEREVFEVDLRYDINKGKIFNPPAYCDSLAFLRFSYGLWTDQFVGATDREGDYGFIEATWNVTPAIYLASRLSLVDFEKATTASLNGITANKYRRYSVGCGYRLTQATLIKLGYDWNKESGPNIKDADNGLLAIILSSQF